MHHKGLIKFYQPLLHVDSLLLQACNTQLTLRKGCTELFTLMNVFLNEIPIELLKIHEVQCILLESSMLPLFSRIMYCLPKDLGVYRMAN